MKKTYQNFSIVTSGLRFDYILIQKSCKSFFGHILVVILLYLGYNFETKDTCKERRSLVILMERLNDY